MTKLPTSATLEFVDRVEEMGRIRDALNTAKEGKGQLLVVRGEAGSGKTRLTQEAATEAEKRGFSVGFGTSLAESVTPYHPWKEILEKLDLDAILEEAPPPKLLGVLCLSSEGKIRVKVFRKGEESRSPRQDDSILKSIHDLVSGRRKNDEETVAGTHDQYRLVIVCHPTFSLAAILEGREDEIFLADMRELAKTVDSMLVDKKLKNEVNNSIKIRMLQLIESEKYEGIDYTKDDPKLRQGRFFELVTLGLSRKACVCPLCVVIDDLQWADPSSLALLQYVSRNTRSSEIFLFGTHRIEEAEARPHLRKALEGMKQEELVDEIDLKGLSRTDLPDLTSSFIGAHDLHDDFLDMLWRETQGNPLFVREVLKGLEEEGAISVHGAVKRLVRPLDQLAIPERVREVIRTRLKRLPEEDRRLLDAAATCGTRFTASLVAKVAGEEEIKVLNGLRAIAKVHGLLRPVDSSFTFDHPAVQEVLYDGVPADIRQNYHREAAEWLELAGGPNEDIGEHYRSAGDYRAVAMLCRAASTARAEYANEEAIRFYKEALELEEDVQKKAEIFELLGSICALIGDYVQSLEWFKRELVLTDDYKKRAFLLTHIGGCHAYLGNYEEAINICNQGLELVEGEGCMEEAKILHGLGFANYERGEYNRAVEYYQKSIKINEKIGDRKNLANSLNNLGSVYGDWGKTDSAIEYYKKSLAIREELGDLVGIAASLHNIGAEHMIKGEYDKSIEYLQRSEDISKRTGHRLYLGNHLGGLGEVYLHKGDFDKALKYFEKSLAIKEGTGSQAAIAGTLHNISDVYYRLGENQRALEYLEKSLKISKNIGHRLYMANNLSAIGRLHAKRGHYDQALEYYQESLKLFKEIGTQWGLSWIYCEIAEAHNNKGNLKKAMNYCELAMSSSKKAGRKDNIACANMILGMIYRKKENWTKSIEYFNESLRIFRDLKEEPEIGRLHYEFGLMWKAKGNTNDARKHFNSATEVFQKLKMMGDLKKVREALENI